jgi:Skp family chaperone for outer membrane proteins
MTIAEPLASAEDKSLERNIPKFARTGAAFRRTESGDGEPPAENLSNLLRQILKPSMGEIDNLISELQTLRRKLQTDGDRIERDIAKYAELNQQVMQLTTIISDSVKKLPGASGISR